MKLIFALALFGGFIVGFVVGEGVGEVVYRNAIIYAN